MARGKPNSTRYFVGQGEETPGCRRGKRKANGTAPNKPLTYASSLQGAGSPVSLKPFAAAPPLGHLKAACVQSCGGFACATCLRVPCVMKLFH